MLTCAGRYEFARERFLCIRTLQDMGSLKRQLLEALSEVRMLTYADVC